MKTSKTVEFKPKALLQILTLENPSITSIKQHFHHNNHKKSSNNILGQVLSFKNVFQLEEPLLKEINQPFDQSERRIQSRIQEGSMSEHVGMKLNSVIIAALQIYTDQA